MLNSEFCHENAIIIHLKFTKLQETPGGFAIKDASLSFSVSIFTICAVTTIGCLMVRRSVAFFGNSELGGPTLAKTMSAVFFVSLWGFYVILASLQAYGIIEGF